MPEISVQQFLMKAADQLDDMVRTNLKFGWSTNNNAAMTDMADECRRQAAALQRAA